MASASGAIFRLYTAEQAARLLQVSPAWLRKKATTRAIPCTFIGRYLRFSAADVAMIIDSGSQPSRPELRRS
jgi:excisionase family DNA binding protein